MGLPRALEAHAAGQIDQAIIHYQRAFDQNVNDPRLYQNYGSLLRSQNDNEQSKIVYLSGLKYFPHHTGIRKNYANLLRDSKPAHAYEFHLQSIRLHDETDDARGYLCYLEPLLDWMLADGYINWALSLLHYSIRRFGHQPIFFKYSLLISNECNLDIQTNDMQSLVENSELALKKADLRESLQIGFALARYYLDCANFDKSFNFLSECMRRAETSALSNQMDSDLRDNLINPNAWNYACRSLQAKKLSIGWKYFDYGLVTTAPGKQKWQRALIKPFSSAEISLWQGDALNSKSILILEEQAIGDVMMFLNVIKIVLKEADFVGLLLTKRLKKIYERSFKDYIAKNRLKIFTHEDVGSDHFVPTLFDYQAPIASICRYRCGDDLSMYSTTTPLLVSHSHNKIRPGQYICGSRI